jgi:RND family efflux transporter MFP subunit
VFEETFYRTRVAPESWETKIVMNTRKLLVAGFFLAGLILLLVWVRGGFQSKVPPGRTIPPDAQIESTKTVKAESSPSTGEVTVSGTVVSRDAATVSSRVVGRVVELSADAGDQVAKGQVLLEIDSKELKERETQAVASLESSKADLAKATGDFERFTVLYEKQSIAKKDFDDVKARFEMAQAAEQRANAALDEAKTLVAYGSVTAPFDGIVSAREVNVGDLATVGRPLFSVYPPGTLELVAPAGEQYAPFLKVGGTVTVEVSSIQLKQTTAIREVSPKLDEKTRTVTVKAPLSDAAGLGPGLYGTLTFPTSTSEVITVPADAVTSVGQLESVRVVEDGKIKIRQVKTGRKLDEGKVEILSGVTAGEAVVVK